VAKIKSALHSQLQQIYNVFRSYNIFQAMYLLGSDAAKDFRLEMNFDGIDIDIIPKFNIRSLKAHKLLAVDDFNDEQIKLILKKNKITHLVIFPERKKRYKILAIATGKRQLTENQQILVELAIDDLSRLFQNDLLSTELNDFSSRMEQMVAEMGALHEISRAFESSKNLNQLLEFILQKCQILMKAESASLMLLDEENNELEFRVVLGPKSEEVRDLRLPLGKGIAGWVAQHGEPVLIPDAYADSRFNPAFDKKSGYVTKSMLTVPLIYKSKVIGVVNVLNRLDGERFCESDKTFLTTFASQAALAIENARMLQSNIEKKQLDRELKVAGEIQRLLIPQELPEIPGLAVSATYIPCTEVSGDFYDVIPLSDERYVFVVADVAGKGVPAALIVSTMQASLMAYLEQNQDPLYIINKLNLQLIRNTAEDRFITCFLGLYDARKHTLNYVNAGHNPPILMHANNRNQTLEKGGVFIGSMPWEYECDTITLDEGSIVCMYTDGLVELENKNHEQFGTQRVETLISENAKKHPEFIINQIIESAEKYSGGKKMADDLTIILLKNQ